MVKCLIEERSLLVHQPIVKAQLVQEWKSVLVLWYTSIPFPDLLEVSWWRSNKSLSNSSNKHTHRPAALFFVGTLAGWSLLKKKWLPATWWSRDSNCCTHKLQMSTSGPYTLPGMKSSGAAYSGDPQWVDKNCPGSLELLSPKSA